MLRCIFIVALLSLTAVQSESATLSNVIELLRGRIGVSSDTAVSFTNTDAMGWINQAQDKVVKLGGYIPKEVNILWDESDSLGYALPLNFRFIDQCITRQGKDWKVVRENPGFLGDSTVPQFFVKWRTADSAFFYSKNIYQYNQKIRLFYRASASHYTAMADSIVVKEDLHVHIIEEAYAMYLQSERLFQEATNIIMLNRQDMGVAPQQQGQTR